jgi:hypothetical protein
VSAAIASLFSGFGREFQALSSQAAVFHEEFVQALSAAGTAYANAETTGLSSLKSTLSGAVAAATPNLSVSALGATFIQIGSAKSQAGLGFAIAIGAGSSADALGEQDLAVAAGAGSSAFANDNMNSAFAIGRASRAYVDNGWNNLALSYGESSVAQVGFSSSGVQNDRNVAVAMGTRCLADVRGKDDVAGVFGGTGNRAYAAGNGRVVIIDGDLVDGVTAYSSYEGPVIVPAGAVPNVAISAFGNTLIEVGNAHAESASNNFAIAYGDGAQATAGGGRLDTAIAFGTGTHAVAQGTQTVAVAFGNHDMASAQGRQDFAGVLDGDENSATASGTRNLALILEGDHGVVNASGQNIVKIYPPLT